MKMYRQGDVLIVESERDLRYAKVETDNVLVYGEMTGHAHRAEGENVTVLATSRGKVIDARKAFRVVHEEQWCASWQIPLDAFTPVVPT